MDYKNEFLFCINLKILNYKFNHSVSKKVNKKDVKPESRPASDKKLRRNAKK